MLGFSAKACVVNCGALLTGFLLLVSAAKGQASPSPAAAQDLPDLFKQLTLSRLDRNFPAGEVALEKCRKNKEQLCLDVYAKVNQAKTALAGLAKSHADATFNTTLQTIEKSCEQSSHEHDQLCIGAIIALYFFNQPEHDKKIQTLVNSVAKKTFHRIFVTRYEWYFNRADAEDWIEFINALPESKLHSSIKPAITRYFELSRKTFNKFGIML